MRIAQARQCCFFLQHVLWDRVQFSEGSPAFEMLVQALPILDSLAAAHPGS